MLAANAMPARPAQFDRAAQNQRSMIAKIHVAKRDLHMDEDDYRQILFDQTGETSLTKCPEAKLTLVLKAMQAKGFKPLPGKKAAAHPMARKARAMWISLYHLGAVRNASEQALEAFAQRQLKCERLNWARQSDAYRLIEALKAMAEREGWKQSGAFTPRALLERLCEAILARLKKAGVADESWTIDIAAHRLCGIEQPAAWSAEDFERVAAALGQQLREFGGSAVA